MTTALELINDALLEIGVKDESNALTADQSSHALRVLNRMLALWSQRRLLLPVMSDVSVTLDGSASYTIGPTGDVTAARPLRIEHARAVDANGVEYHVNVMGQPRWNAIPDKAVTGGPPSDIWYEATNTNGIVYVYPKANGYTLKLNCRSLLTSFAGLTTEVTLPDGYEAAIVPNLADAVSSSYGQKTPLDVLRRGTAALRALKNVNAEPLEAAIGLNVSQEFMIERGY